MVDNLLETGTLFDYKDADFTKLMGKKDESHADAPGLQIPAIMVGERDIPDKDNRYIEKDFEDED
jgi:hypothetical protein